MTRFSAISSTFAASLLLALPSVGAAQQMPDLYFVDAHSQMARGLDPATIIPQMDKAGVWHVILSARNDRNPTDVADFASPHPDRVTAAVRTKGGAFNHNKPLYKKLLKSQTDNPVFKAIAEVILFHAAKGNKAPAIEVSATSPQNLMALKAAKKKGWPFVLHYEFAAAGWDKKDLMTEMEALVAEHADHPFLLIHMGQLDAEEVARLIGAHPNLSFMTSHSNPVSIAENPGQPWSRLFEGETLAPKWKALIEKHPDRFVLAFDNVWPEYWGRMFLEQASVWRKALAELPPNVAQAVAHGNAERLWKIESRPPG